MLIGRTQVCATGDTVPWGETGLGNSYLAEKKLLQHLSRGVSALRTDERRAGSVGRVEAARQRSGRDARRRALW